MQTISAIKLTNNLKLAQQLKQKNYDQYVRFNLILRFGHSAFLDRLSLKCPAAERSSSQGYSKVLIKEQKQ